MAHSIRSTLPLSLTFAVAVVGASSGCELVAAVDRSQIDQPDAQATAVCGNGTVEGDEQCDEGAANGSSPCGCTSACRFAAAGTACADTNRCNGEEQCDGRGACAPGAAPLVCDDGAAATADFCVGAVGCAHLAFAAGTNTDVRGNALGGTEYLDACPDGHVLVGLNAKIGDSFDQIQAVCAPVEIDAAVAVTLGAPVTPFPFRGTNENVAAGVMCPANQFVVGFAGRAGGLVDQLALRCASIVVAESGGTFAATLGTVTVTTPLGGTGGVAFADTDCAAGSLAVGANIRAGGSVDAFGLLCGAPSVTK